MNTITSQESQSKVNYLTWVNNQYLPAWLLCAFRNTFLLAGSVGATTSNTLRKSNQQALLSANLQSSIAKSFEVSSLIPTVISNFRSLLVILFFVIFLAPIANATNYYVNTNGSDTNPGSLASPWQIGRAHV